jgi:hypothetical protein
VNEVSMTTTPFCFQGRFSPATVIKQPSLGTMRPKCAVRMKLRPSE